MRSTVLLKILLVLSVRDAQFNLTSIARAAACSIARWESSICVQQTAQGQGRGLRVSNLGPHSGMKDRVNEECYTTCAHNSRAPML